MKVIELIFFFNFTLLLVQSSPSLLRNINLGNPWENANGVKLF
jgi:hypothetical protein